MKSFTIETDKQFAKLVIDEKGIIEYNKLRQVIGSVTIRTYEGDILDISKEFNVPAAVFLGFLNSLFLLVFSKSE